jgi:N-methylhydantoinase A
VLKRLRAAGEHELDADGVPPARRAYRYLGDLRYIGQFHEILVELPDELLQACDPLAISALFHRQHEANYGHADPKAPVEIVNLRIEATGKLGTPQFTDVPLTSVVAARPARHRKVMMAAGDAAIDVPVYDRAALGDGQRFDGPAIVTQLDSTTVVLSGQRVTVGKLGTLRITEVQP